jgi:hypothetical protein
MTRKSGEAQRIKRKRKKKQMKTRHIFVVVVVGGGGGSFFLFIKFLVFQNGFRVMIDRLLGLRLDHRRCSRKI